TARARVAARDQREVGGEVECDRGTGDAHDAFLQRLPQRLEHAGVELRDLVEEQRAAMRERDLSRARSRAATADDGGDRRGVVRRAERSAPDEATGGRDATGGMDTGDLDRLLRLEGREDRRKPAGEHRLARARRSRDEEMVTARGGGR